jgi:hypothetical protein
VIWYPLDEIYKGLQRRGFDPIATNDPGVIVYKGPRGSKPMSPRVPIPMGQGDALPEPVLRKILSEVEFDVDEFIDELTPSS